MRTILASAVLLVSAVIFLSSGVQGGEKKGKAVTIQGTITCAKCDLKKEKACATVVVDKKDNIYYFDTASHKKNHGKICTESREGTVTGTVSTQGNKKVITVSSVKFKD